MKQFISEYGRSIFLVLVGIVAMVWVNQVFLGTTKDYLKLPEEKRKKQVVKNIHYHFPELRGLEKNGKPLTVKIDANTKFNPISMPGKFNISAVDTEDGDLTDRIKVYVVKIVDGKEKKLRLKTELDTSGKEVQMVLLYKVMNSAGFYVEKRMSLAIDKIGEEEE